ncbi:MAG: sodium/solute symporter [Verrucomicrobia bacterium]|nr:sodium/solute symporter [Verrucomicrobiota bacterium]
MLTTLDYSILAAYFAATLAIGFWSARRAKTSSKDFFVAEKRLPWWVVGFTMVAAGISAEQMLGEVGYGMDVGLVVSNWDLAVFPSLALMVLIFLPIYLRSGITTIPEYLEKRYSQTTRLLFTGYTVFNNACVTLVMVLALGATALKHFLGLPPLWGVTLLAVFSGLYTVAGGMSSVAWTDTFQCVLLLLGGLTVFGVGLAHVPGGWDGLLSRMPEPHLIRGLDDVCMPWPGLILLALSTNVWYCCTNQFYVQSCLGAKDRWHGQMGVLLTAFLGPVLTLCCAFPGYIARDLLNHGLLPPLPTGADGVADANATLPHLVNQFIGPGLRGFVVAAVLAAIMSSVSSIVNATASVFTIDLYQRWLRPRASEAQLVRVGRFAGTVTLLIAAPLTLVALRYKYIFIYSQNAWCILAIPIMLAFTLGVLWKRTTAAATTVTFLLVLPFVAVPFVLGDSSWLTLPLLGVKMHLFTFAFWLWLVAALVMVAVSLMTKAPDAAAIARYVWSPTAGRDDGARASQRPWFKRVGFWCAVAGVMYFVIYVKFW